MWTVGTAPATRGKKLGDSSLLENCSMANLGDVNIDNAAKGGLGSRRQMTDILNFDADMLVDPERG